MSRWIRWRLLAICAVVGLMLPLGTLVQAIINIHRFRVEGRGSTEAAAAARLAANYAQEATFSFETLGTLALWGLEITTVAYGIAIAAVWFRARLRRTQNG